MKDFVAENDRILEEWKRKYVEENQSKCSDCENLLDKFAQDGIMYKGDYKKEWTKHKDGETTFRWMRVKSGKENDLWDSVPLRILFLTKDQNSSKAWDVRSESYFYSDEKYEPRNTYYIDGSTFNRNLVYTLYGLVNTTAVTPVDYYDKEFTDEIALKLVDKWPFARINVKKEVGNDRCDDSVLLNAIENDGDLIKEQILNLNADIFVCCGYSKNIPGTGNRILNFLRTIYEDLNQVDNDKIGEWIFYSKKDRKLAINSYHPSYSRYSTYFNNMMATYSEFLKLPDTLFSTKLR